MIKHIEELFIITASHLNCRIPSILNEQHSFYAYYFQNRVNNVTKLSFINRHTYETYFSDYRLP